jgi:hypothetical protein
VPAVAAVALSAALALPACSGAGHDADTAPAAIDEDSVRDGFELFRSMDVEALFSTEKIRRGQLIDYDEVVGNGVVFIANESGTCSAQVINRWFLLTAAHCVEGMLTPVSGGALAGNVEVSFTDRARQRILKYSGSVLGYTQPGWRLKDKDTGLLYLPGGINTCHGTRTQCPTSQPDAPENAAFQFFMPGFPLPTLPLYPIVGYGGTTFSGADAGTLRVGVMQKQSASFTDNNQGFQFVLPWQSDTAARICPGDSGSPLVFTTQGHIGHTSIASFGTSCNTTSGTADYSGLSQAQFNWVASQMSSVGGEFQLAFDCSVGANASSGLAVFHCDNDGSLH